MGFPKGASISFGQGRGGGKPGREVDSIMYSKILVPLDGSPLAEQILPYVRLLAVTDNIPVELFWANDVEIAQWQCHLQCEAC